jgi:hypothetical protein
MSKKYQQQNREEQAAQEGVIAAVEQRAEHEVQSAEHEVQSATQVEQSATSDAGAETGAEQSTEHVELSTEDIESLTADDTALEEAAKPVVFGIGQFVRHMLKNSTKTNAEILELTLKAFEGSKTTAACIAWYKTDMRKKGLLPGGVQRGRTKTVELSAAELEALTK